MSEIIEMNYGDSRILIETPEHESSGLETEVAYRGLKQVVTRKVDQALDKLLQREVLDHCQNMTSIINQVRKLPHPPQKIHTEFGFQVDAEGNLYVTKISSASSFKIQIEWEIKSDTREK